MKKHIITIGGRLGSGKSSTGKLLAEKLGYQRFSMGDLQREYAEKLGMDFSTYSEMQKTDHSLDKKVDLYQKEIAQIHDNFVLDSRLGWFFIPNSFKVFLDLPTEIAAGRILTDSQNNPYRRVEVGEFEDKKTIIENMERRIDSERVRYKDLYGIENHFDNKNYDLVIKTDKYNLQEVVSQICIAYENWKKG